MTSGKLRSGRSPSTSRSGGFTLIEVIVALGIAGGALVLLRSANQAAMQQSLRARKAAAVERICESKLDEIRCGAETATRGEFSELPGWTWELRHDGANIEALEDMERLTLHIYLSGGSPSAAKSFVLYRHRGRPAKS